MMACQVLITGLIARVANEQPDRSHLLTDFRDEIKAVVKGVNIAGMDNAARVRHIARTRSINRSLLMKPPNAD